MGNSCPVCHVQAWAKELQVKRELANVVKLYNKMCRLVDPSNTPASGDIEGKKDEVTEVAGSEVDLDAESVHNVDDGTSQSRESVVEDSQEVGTQLVGTQQRHHIKKIVKTVVGKHGKLSCIVKRVCEDDGNESLHKKQTSVTARKNLASENTLSHKQLNTSSSGFMTDSSDSVGSVEEADSMGVYDFIASPSRPKPIKKKKVKKVDPKVLRARRVAAANKKWSKSSKVTKKSSKQKKGGGRHVSFREETDSDTRKHSEYSVESMDTGSDSMWDDVDTEDDQIEAGDNNKATTQSVSLEHNRNQRLTDAQTTTGPGGDNNSSVTSKKSRRKSDSKSPVRSSPSGKGSSPSGKENAVSGVRDNKGVSPGKASAKRNIRGETPLHIAAIKVNSLSDTKQDYHDLPWPIWLIARATL